MSPSPDSALRRSHSAPHESFAKNRPNVHSGKNLDLFLDWSSWHSCTPYSCVVGLCLFLGNTKEDIQAKKFKKNATEKWTPKNQDAKKLQKQCKKCKSIFIAKIKMQKMQEKCKPSCKKMQEICNNSCICPATFCAIEISIFSAFYTMKRRNNGFWQTVATQ